MMKAAKMDADGPPWQQNVRQRPALTSHHNRIWHGHLKSRDRSQLSINPDNITRRKKVTRKSTSWAGIPRCSHPCAQKRFALPSSASIAGLLGAQGRYLLISLFLVIALLTTIAKGKLGDYAGAIADYIRAIELQPRYSVGQIYDR